MRIKKENDIRDSDKISSGCGILVKKGAECGISEDPSFPNPTRYIASVTSLHTLIRLSEFTTTLPDMRGSKFGQSHEPDHELYTICD